MSRGSIATLVLGASLTAMADFADDSQAAKKHLEGKDYPVAHQASTKLVASALNDRGKAYGRVLAISHDSGTERSPPKKRRSLPQHFRTLPSRW